MPVAIIRVPRIWAPPQPSTPPPILEVLSPLDGLDAFGSEKSEPVTTLVAAPLQLAPQPSVAESTPPAARSARSALKWVAVVALSASASMGAMWQYQRRAATSSSGTLTIQTVPANAEVFIAGASVGRTPFTTTLSAGNYDVQVRVASETRNLKIAMLPGGSVLQQLEISATPAASPEAAVGSLRVQTDGAVMAVSVDGVERGSSPLTIHGLQAGEHQVVVKGEHGTFRRTVKVSALETVSLVVSPVEPKVAAPGWLKVSSPVVLQLREGGTVIGTTEAEKLMLSAGSHEIEIRSDSLEYRTVQKIDVASGKTSEIAVQLPSGVLNINAQPWAEVWVDGARVGETPIANLSQRIGTHDVVFRHPQFGERRETVVVTLRQPVRLGVDMRRQ
jgi:PEGA domain